MSLQLRTTEVGNRMKLILAVLCLFIAMAGPVEAYHGHADSSRTLAWYVEAIEAGNEVEIWGPYCAQRPSPQYKYFLQMKKIATTDELVDLTRHHSGVVRGYAFLALSHRDNVNLLDIISRHVADSEQVSISYCCIGWYVRVGDIMIDFATSRRFGDGLQRLDSLQLARLDSMLIFTPNQLDARESALTRMAPRPGWYSQVRELVTRDRYGAALIALAKYRKPEDIGLILGFYDTEYPNWVMTGSPYPSDSCRSYAFRAMAEFPHPNFLPVLTSYLEATPTKPRYCRHEYSEWLKAVAAFENGDAVALISRFVGVESSGSGKRYPRIPSSVLDAMRDHLIPQFEDFLWWLWEDQMLTTPEVLAYLAGRDSARAFHAAVVNLRRPSSEFDDYTGSSVYRDSTLFSATVDFIRCRDTSLATELLCQSIATADWNAFQWLSLHVRQTRDSSYIEPLFARLTAEDNPNTYLQVVEALLSYDSPAIDLRILDSRRKNHHLLDDWGGRMLASLLREHGIHWRRLYE